MNGNATLATSIDSLTDNEYIKDLLNVLHKNGKDASGLTALVNYVVGMEHFCAQAENQIANMKVQLDDMKEIQDHPIKHALQKTIAALEAKLVEIKAHIAELKSNIVEGCKSALTAFKTMGASALDKLASFFNIKGSLESIIKSADKSADACDKACVKIETFSKQYHTAGHAIKNMVRMVIGKEPISTIKESGRLANALTAYYKNYKSNALGIRGQCEKMIAALNTLEKSVAMSRSEKTDNPQKPMLMENLQAKRKEIQERERITPLPDRARKIQAEI